MALRGTLHFPAVAEEAVGYMIADYGVAAIHILSRSETPCATTRYVVLIITRAL